MLNYQHHEVDSPCRINLDALQSTSKKFDFISSQLNRLRCSTDIVDKFSEEELKESEVGRGKVRSVKPCAYIFVFFFSSLPSSFNIFCM